MNTRFNRGLIILLSVFSFSMVSYADVTLQIIPDSRLNESQIIYLSDFDFLEAGNIAERLFTVRLINDRAYDNCIMKVQLLRNGTQLAFITTHEFDMPYNSEMGYWEISNIDLSNGTFQFPGTTEDVRIADSGIKDNIVDDLATDMFSSGRLPSGNYDLAVEIRSQDLPNPSETTHPFFITNPTMINLVTPGSQAGTGYVEEIYAEFPVFQWNGSSGEYQVLVFEKKSDFESLDDILNSFPNWKSERLTTLSVQYPSAGGSGDSPVIPLEFGRTYYWLVKMFIQTSSGENEILSEIWTFKLTDPTNMIQTPDDLAKEDIQQLLSQLLGTQQAEEIARGVTDFHLKSIRINGRPITVHELYQIIDQYRGQDLQVLDLIMQQSN